MMKQVDDKYDCQRIFHLLSRNVGDNMKKSIMMMIMNAMITNMQKKRKKDRSTLKFLLNVLFWLMHMMKELIDICKVMEPQNYENK